MAMFLQFVGKCYRCIRGAIATTVMISVAPTYLIIHTGCRIISLILPRKCGYLFDDFLWGTYQKLVLYFFEHVTGAEIILSGDIPNEKENVILICNHQCSVDWVVTDMIAIRQNMIGNLRYVFKDSIKYLPLYGYAFGVHGGVYVRRDGTYNEANMKRTLTHFNDSNVLTWFVVFPEGTRFSTKRTKLLAKSQAYAIENDLKPLNQVLTPRVKAFHCAVNVLQNNATAVYDATIVYEEKSEPPAAGTRYPAPNMWRFLIGPSPRIYIRFDRIPISEVPVETQSATLAWLHSRFERKDALISRHFGLVEEEEKEKVIAGVVTSSRSGVRPIIDESEDLKNGQLSTISLSQTRPSAVFLTGFTILLLANQAGRLIYLTSLFGGSIATVLYSRLFF